MAFVAKNPIPEEKRQTVLFTVACILGRIETINHV